MLVDDLGYHDVSWHNSDIIMPNIDKLASDGVKLENHYVQASCSPSRSALLTGYYPIRTGMQHLLPIWKRTGLYTNYTLLPEYLKKIGYKTHALGKWHLGFCDWAYYPMNRGFDTFNGYIGQSADYYTHATGKNGTNYDYWKNYQSDPDAKGVYQAKLMAYHSKEIINNHVKAHPNEPLLMYLAFHSVHKPIQVPEKYIRKYNHLKHKENRKRRTMMGMVTALDDAVGKIVKKLKNKGLFDNTLFLFTSDNGGRSKFGARNTPLKGEKFELYEGGTKTAAFISGPKIFEKFGDHSNQLIHITDWLPTLISMANGSSPVENIEKCNCTEIDCALCIDGLNQWPHFSQNITGIRSEMLYGIGEKHMAAYRLNEMKLLVRETVCGADNGNESIQQWCSEHQCKLYDLASDPSENQNLALNPGFAEKLQELKDKLREQCDVMIPSVVIGATSTSASNPANFGGNVSPGWCTAKP